MHVPHRFSGIGRAGCHQSCRSSSLASGRQRPAWGNMSEPESVSREEPLVTSRVAVADAESEPETGRDADATGPVPRPTAPRAGAVRGGVPGGLIRLAWLAGLIAAGIVLYLCYLQISRTARVSSDGASNALQAWAMLHGNPMLRGWTVTDVSFYTTELLEYALVEMVRGLQADVLHVSAAISYTLVVLTGAMLARGRATGREGVVRMLIAGGIMVAPQLGPGVFILVFQPDHIGTQAPLLLTWLVLDRFPRRWYTSVLVGAMLAWVIVADQLALLIGVAPLAVVSAIRAYQALVQRREGLRVAWFDLSLVLAAGASAVIASEVVKQIGAHGGYYVLPVKNSLAPITEMSSHAWLAVESVFGLYGADFFGMTSPGLDGAIALLHLVGLALAVAGLWVVLRHFFRCGTASPRCSPSGSSSTWPPTCSALCPPRTGALVRWPGCCRRRRAGGPDARPPPHGRPADAGPGRGAGLLPGGARLHGRPAVPPRHDPGPGRLARRAPPDLRPEQLRHRQHHHAGQRRQGQRALRQLLQQQRRPGPVRVRPELVRPEPPQRQFHRADEPARPPGPDRALAGPQPVRDARPRLRLRPVRHPDLRHQPAHRPEPVDPPAAPSPVPPRPRPPSPTPISSLFPTAPATHRTPKTHPTPSAQPSSSAHLTPSAQPGP